MLENTTDTLQIKINEARALLSKETKEAIDSVSWKLIVQGFNNRYSADQIEVLETETELLLCGILGPDTYQKEIENRMGISKIESGRLIEELDKSIFKKIQEKLISILSEKKEDVVKYNVKKIDSRFDVLPGNLQDAISKSDYQSKVYEIAQKYKLSIDKMGIFEEIIIKTILGNISLNNLDSELKSKINLSDEENNALIKDVNEEIFKDIRGLLKSESKKINENTPEQDIPLPPYEQVVSGKGQGIGEKEKIKPEEEIPVPNYSKTTNKEEMLIPMPNYSGTTNEKEMYVESGIEMVNEELVSSKEKVVSGGEIVNSKEQVISQEKDSKTLEDFGIDIIGEKLVGPTANTTTTSDYTIPKMGDK